MNKHNSEKSQKCSQCDFSSRHAQALRQHLKRRHGEKTHRCDQCGYASTAVDLRSHGKIHNDERPHKYDQCEYASSKANNMRIHMKTHTGENRHTNTSTKWIYLLCNRRKSNTMQFLTVGIPCNISLLRRTCVYQTPSLRFRGITYVKWIPKLEV